MERHLFELFKPIFTIGYLIGFFPCKISNDDECVRIIIAPLDWKFQWGLYSLAMITIGQLPVYTTILLYSYENERHFDELLQCFITSTSAINDSSIDAIALAILFSCTALNCTLVQYGNFKTKDGLCKLGRLESRPRHRSSDRKILKSFANLFLCVISFCLANALFNSWMVPSCFDLSTLAFPIILFMTTFIQLIVMVYPFIIWISISLEILANLIEHCKHLRSDRSLELSLNTHYSFIQFLETSTETLSMNNFFTMSTISIQIMILLYIIPHQFANACSVSLFSILAPIANLLYLLLSVLLVWYLNTWSQMATDEVHWLADRLRKIHLEDGTKLIEFEDQIVPMSFMKGHIEEKLMNFQGFDGRGYFILGKSFLKNLLAFCATYFIILIQFKLSELTSNETTSVNATLYNDPQIPKLVA